jgi:hypothetical protein
MWIVSFALRNLLNRRLGCHRSRSERICRKRKPFLLLQTEPPSSSPKWVTKLLSCTGLSLFLSELDYNNKCKLKSEDVGINDQLIIIQFCYDEYAIYTAVEIVQPRPLSQVFYLSDYIYLADKSDSGVLVYFQ